MQTVVLLRYEFHLFNTISKCFSSTSIQAEISDASSNQWINFFRVEAEALLGLTAEEFGNHKMNVRRFFPQLVSEASLFSLRSF